MFRLLTALTVLIFLQGCAAAIVAGGVGAAKVAHDRRTVGTQIDDTTLAARIRTKLSEDTKVKEHAHVNINVFNGVALITGQTPTDHLKRDVQKAVESVPNLTKVHNQLRISEPTAITTRTHDVWLASKVRANLLTDKRLDGLHIDIVVEDSEVFLMGLVTAEESGIAVDIARNISGVTRVVKAFELM